MRLKVLLMNAVLSIRLLVAVLALAVGAFGLMPSSHTASVTMPVAAIAANSQGNQHHALQSSSSPIASALMCTGASCAGIPGAPTGYMLLNVRLASSWAASYQLGDGRLLIGPDPFPPKFLHTA